MQANHDNSAGARLITLPRPVIVNGDPAACRLRLQSHGLARNICKTFDAENIWQFRHQCFNPALQYVWRIESGG